MSLLDRLMTLNLLDVNTALAKVENPEEVREAVLREVSGALEAAGAELRQLQRQRDSQLQNRRVAEKDVDEKQAALNNATEADKDHLKKQIEALNEALVRMDEQVAEQNREEASLHKQVARLQDIRREAAEWTPRRKESAARSEPKTETSGPKETARKETSTRASGATQAKTSAQPEAKPDGAAPAEQEDPTDPFVKMKRLKEKMEAFQAQNAIDEEELRAFMTERAIAEEETKRVIEQNLNELKKKMRGE
jgi:hypothetical protein